MRAVRFKRVPAAALGLAITTTACPAVTSIYLGEYKFNDPMLHAMGPGGSDVTPLTVIPAVDWLVVGLQVDPAAGKIYWTHGSFNDGRIRRANFDGTEMELLLSGLTNPRGLALDLAGGKMYFSDTQDEVMYRAGLDGSGLEAVVDVGQQLGRPTLDLVNGKLYFGLFGTGQIVRTNLDGSSPEVILGGLYTPVAIALDLEAGKIYWADSNTSFVSNHIARANLDGTDIEILYEGLPTSSGFTGIELDLAAGKLYWCDEITDAEKGVWWADLDGSGAERIFESREGWNAGAMTLVPGPPCPWDLDGDGVVGILDFLELLAAWGMDPGGPPDFDGDGAVGILDFLELLGHWGPCP